VTARRRSVATLIACVEAWHAFPSRSVHPRGAFRVCFSCDLLIYGARRRRRKGELKDQELAIGSSGVAVVDSIRQVLCL
jgi:hypothetical protein